MNMMNMNLLTAEQIALAIQTGKDWGHAEADLWRDQNPDKASPEWTYGTYSGTFPDDVDDDDEVRDVFETTLDDAARKAWDAFFSAE